MTKTVTKENWTITMHESAIKLEDNMVEVIIGFIDRRFQGKKTYILMGLGMAMMGCQMFGFHSFSESAWGMLGIGGAATWKMGIDRPKK